MYCKKHIRHRITAHPVDSQGEFSFDGLAGANPTKSTPGNMPLFKKTFAPLTELAEACNVKTGFKDRGKAEKMLTISLSILRMDTYVHEASEILSVWSI